MNKAGRKSGGLSKKKPSEELKELLKWINACARLINDSQMDGLHIPGAKQFIESFENDGKVPPDNYWALRQMDDFYRSDITNSSYISYKMRWLEEVLKIMPEDFALHILSQSPHFVQRGLNKLLHELKSLKLEIFDDEDTEAIGPMDFYLCMSRYEELILANDLIENLLSLKKVETRRAKNFFKRKENEDKLFQTLVMPPESSVHIRIGFDSHLHLAIYLNEPFKILNGVEIDRIRRCSNCNDYFWAERTNNLGCIECRSILSAEKKRKYLTPEKRREYRQDIQRRQNAELRKKLK